SGTGVVPGEGGGLFAAGPVPQPHRTSPRGQGLAVGAERDRRGPIPLQDAELLAAADIPEHHRFTNTPRDHRLAVGAETPGMNPAVFRPECSGVLAAGYVPQLHGLVLTSRGQGLAVGAERDANDRPVVLAGELDSGPWLVARRLLGTGCRKGHQ